MVLVLVPVVVVKKVVVEELMLVVPPPLSPASVSFVSPYLKDSSPILLVFTCPTEFVELVLFLALELQ